LLVLFVVTVNLALSAAETRDERDVLAVVGASPATTRRTNGYKAGLICAMGALLAVPVGFLPVVVFLTAHDSVHLPIVFPWRMVALLVVALPVVAGLVTTGASAMALKLRPVRVSKMAFD
jgi:ABC-type antimicrobial peptide transport system permease subunit